MGTPEIVLPENWPRPSGYSHAVAVTGRIIVVSGQIGWDPRTRTFSSSDLADQVRIALENVRAVLGAAAATPADIIRMTWFITDREAYLRDTRRIGEAYRSVCGNHYPAMSVVVVAGLLEPNALVEIEATAVIPS